MLPHALDFYLDQPAALFRVVLTFLGDVAVTLVLALAALLVCSGIGEDLVTLRTCVLELRPCSFHAVRGIYIRMNITQERFALALVAQ